MGGFSVFGWAEWQLKSCSTASDGGSGVLYSCVHYTILGRNASAQVFGHPAGEGCRQCAREAADLKSGDARILKVGRAARLHGSYLRQSRAQFLIHA